MNVRVVDGAVERVFAQNGALWQSRFIQERAPWALKPNPWAQELAHWTAKSENARFDFAE